MLHLWLVGLLPALVGFCLVNKPLFTCPHPFLPRGVIFGITLGGSIVQSLLWPLTIPGLGWNVCVIYKRLGGDKARRYFSLYWHGELAEAYFVGLG